MSLTKDQLHSALVESGGITDEQFQEAASRKEAAQIGIDGVIVAHGILKDEQMGQLLGIWYNVGFVNLRNQEVKKESINLLPEAFAREHQMLPISKTESSVTIATSSPNDVLERAMLEKYLRTEITFAYATPTDLRGHMYLFQKDPKEAFRVIIDRSEEKIVGTDTRTIDLVNSIIDYAYQAGASDIHIEPEDEYTMVRYRQDGILHDVAELPVRMHENIMTRLKVLARLATDEHRAAQDGKIDHETPWGDGVEIRLSILPTTHAEKAVMRLLSSKSHAHSLTDLGLSEGDFKKVSNVIHKPWGAILVTGPTGSGKTTTLYAVLRVLNQREVNITTIEDPVEFDIEGVNQIQVNEKTGLTFSKGLRSIVRQDPDIIMVGEIRDKETAAIAVNAAMTGHLVLSTLHTNDASTTFLRLTDMGVEVKKIAQREIPIPFTRADIAVSQGSKEVGGIRTTLYAIDSEVAAGFADILSVTPLSLMAMEANTKSILRLISRYRDKEFLPRTPKELIAIVDVGHSWTSVSVYTLKGSNVFSRSISYKRLGKEKMKKSKLSKRVWTA